MAHYHDRAAYIAAKKVGGEYTPKRSPDIRALGVSIEVKTYAAEIPKAVAQLGGGRSRKKYICLPASECQNALEKLRGSGIGIIDRKGNIIKRARRSR